ncbi:IS200/IS605 family element transposase accessory protein TnpB [Planosporangium flavigriseum]|uniref:Transposase n=1 Tax=Planosporangium flavigriseum TaxID=373681 RepID=A0A8J3LY47_9ACTN|nr:RNA-guided endonuclease TnpB family protein [Planosporangium flavigriseum]NJC65400.1 IS200/IS605 family element transposase accessory protein TnpB [Planosporangium flavigriseum]GIG73245.1 transposase [Planosporangium flavigriseum]
MPSATGDDDTPLVSHTGAPLTRPVTFVFTLDPTAEQDQLCFQYAGAFRLVFNHHIARVFANLDQRAAEKSYGITDAELTPALSWSKVSFINHMNAWKNGYAPDSPVTEIADGTVVRGLPWRGAVSADVFETASVNAAQALKNWRDSFRGERKGKKVGRPRFKAKHRTTPAFRLRCKYTEGKTPPVRPAGPRAMRLPKLGEIRVAEHTGKLSRMLETGRFHAYAAAFTYRNGRWQVAVTGMATQHHHLRRSARHRHDRPAGVDLGVKALAVVADSDGLVLHEWTGVKPLQRAQARLKLANQALARTKQGSNGRRKAVRSLGKIHARIRQLRRQLLHDITTTLVTRCSTLVIEDLNVTGMVRNRSLARHISDAALGELRRQLEYKTAWYGARLVVADRWYPSSKTCSRCGHVDDGLTLADRTYRCAACGLELDRDVNAAINLATLALERAPDAPPPQPVAV